MNVFDILRENINKKKEYFQKFYEVEGKTEVDEDLNKATQLAFDDAVEIVNQVESEYNNGWIPCSERMPEEHDSILLRSKALINGIMQCLKKTSDTVNVTVVDGSGNRTTTHAHTIDGKWVYGFLKIIAWQPLPEPYREG